MAVNPAVNLSPGMPPNAASGSGLNAGAGLFDAAGLQRLREAAHDNSPEALRKASTQFEALFLDMVMKSMRDAMPAEGLMDSEQGRTMQGMLDQQYAKALATRGIGLADVLVRQLSPKGVATAAGTDRTAAPASSASSASSTSTVPTDARVPSPSAADAAGKPSAKRSFVDKLMAHAETVSAATGIPSRFMVAHAALESGWGRREIRNADGSNSHNVFGIKAGTHWKGKVTDVTTTEYVNGLPQKRVERFRAYDSYADAFADYAKTLTHSPRYREVVASAADASGFAQGLQKAGYATDPRYAQKLTRVIARV